MTRRKKLSQLTPIERMNRMMKDISWEDAEIIGIEIVARCLAKRLLVDEVKQDYIDGVFLCIVSRAFNWAEDNTSAIACAKVYKKHIDNKGEKHEEDN